MKRLVGPLSLLALIAALAVVGTAGASHRVTSPVKGSLKYCSDPTFPPMESTTTSGKPVGFDIDLAGVIAKLWKVKAKFVQTAFPGLLPARERRLDELCLHLPELRDHAGEVDVEADGLAARRGRLHRREGRVAAVLERALHGRGDTVARPGCPDHGQGRDQGQQGEWADKALHRSSSPRLDPRGELQQREPLTLT